MAFLGYMNFNLVNLSIFFYEIGGFECVCPQGYMLKSDGRGCIDMRKEMCFMNFLEGVCSKPMTTPQVCMIFYLHG